MSRRGRRAPSTPFLLPEWRAGPRRWELQALALGALCNALVCVAVWLTYSARTTTDKILAVIPPITAFVAAGFEHSVANMYFIPIGLLVREDSTSRKPPGFRISPASPGARSSPTISFP